MIVPLTNPIDQDATLVDEGGRKAQISQAGELVTGGKYDDISINFQYGLRTADIRSGGFVSGTGAVGSVGAMVYAETGTGHWISYTRIY
jgi:hypothetical protein